VNTKTLWKYLPPAGPVLSLTLIGCVLLSALLYYRAIKIQRFLEPALALSQPRNEFAKSINQLFVNEFGAKPLPGVKIKSSAVLMDKARLFTKSGALAPSAGADLDKLAGVFLALMKDGARRADISLVLIMIRFPSYGPRDQVMLERMRAQQMIGMLQDGLFQAEPELAVRYSTYFICAAQPTNPHESNSEVVEFRIVPSEYLHIKVLEKLEKYSM
jgi:hypothetical protein